MTKRKTGVTIRPKRASATHSRKSPAPAAAVESAPVDPNEIARLAYALWEARGGVGGSPEEDWLQAEQELQNG